MRVWCLGDVFNQLGVDAAVSFLKKNKLESDLAIVNAENALGCGGLNSKIALELYLAGADVITSGNHVWDNNNFCSEIENLNYVIRPINMPTDHPGKGYFLLKKAGKKVMVINAIGTTFFHQHYDNPFEIVVNLVNAVQAEVDYLILDFHAEATSEKKGMLYALDGKVALVFGTHTHIPTADAHITDLGTGYQSDLGMCGVYDSILGVNKVAGMDIFYRSAIRVKKTPAKGKVHVCGLLANLVQNKCTAIKSFIAPKFTTKLRNQNE